MTFGPQTWSTAALPPGERFAHWREVRAKAIFGVSIELDRRQHRTFHGQFSILRVGDASLVELHASAYAVRRTESDIVRMSGDALCIYQQLDGGGWFDAGEAEFVVSSGELATSHSDLPYRTRPTLGAGFHLRLVKIPFARCRDRVGDWHGLAARPLQIGSGISALFASYFESFVAQAPHLHGAEADLAVETLSRLAMAARGVPTGR